MMSILERALAVFDRWVAVQEKDAETRAALGARAADLAEKQHAHHAALNPAKP